MLINTFSPFEGGRGMIMDQNFNYNKNLKTFARQHRNYGTKAEIRLWCEILRNKHLMGYSFLRQRPIGKYIADFFCKDLLLVLETDGYTHTLEETHLKDIEKTAYFDKFGISVLRFNDDEVINTIENVRHTLEIWIEDHPPTPFKEGNSASH
jgi:very-short-patch-repair endonuclease